ncbi:MAG: hypothetical protein KJ941_02685 [Bacteroidetes bacterium]|nr:hypothetical protein [Bacteroidota bacterium]
MYTIHYLKEPCPECNSSVFGRIDKRFCSIKCKNNHHNNARRRNKPLTQEVNRQLARNFTILEGLTRENGACMQVHQNALSRHGFCFETVTGASYRNGVITYKCYHFTYVIGKDGVIRVRTNAKIRNEFPGFFRRWTIDFPDEFLQAEKQSDIRTIRSPLSKIRKR